MSGYSAPYRREPTINPWVIRLPILFVSGVVLLVGTLVALVTAFQFNYSDKIVPGMSAYGVNLSGMTHDQAVQALSAQFTYDKKAVFTFRYGDKFWQMTAGELGIGF